MTDTIPIFVVQLRPRGDKELAARGFGWPEYEETGEGNDKFIETMQQLESEIDYETIDPETKVAEIQIRRSDNSITNVKVLSGD